MSTVTMSDRRTDKVIKRLLKKNKIISFYDDDTDMDEINRELLNISKRKNKTTIYHYKTHQKWESDDGYPYETTAFIYSSKELCPAEIREFVLAVNGQLEI